MTDSTPTGLPPDLSRRLDALEAAIRDSHHGHQVALAVIDAHLTELEATKVEPLAPYRRPRLRWNAQLAASVCAGIAASAVIALLFLLNTAR